MIEQQAKVIRCTDELVWLEAERQSTCASCKLKKGCGTGLLANRVGKRFSQIAVNKTHEVTVGQQVNVAIPEETLLQGAALMYLLPLMLMFVFAGAAKLLNLNELVEIFAGISGLFIGFTLVKLRLRNKRDGFKARILEE